MWRNDDLYVALWQSDRPGTLPKDPIEAVRAGKRAGTALPACPLMHGTGLFIALSTLAGGGTVVLIAETGLDADLVWSEVARNRVSVLTIVGDVFARPLLAALDAEPDRWDLTALRAITSSGVTFSPDAKTGLMRHLPGVTIIDALGSSEGIMTRSEAKGADDVKPARFAVNERVSVLDEDTGEPVAPGSGQVGLVGVTGPIPLGYWGDDEKSRATFREYDGRRWSIPGDYATVEPDGSITLLGRGNACINTGGEKVYPEEVEVVLRDHPAVADCVVVGVPDARFGEMVVAVVAPDARCHARRRRRSTRSPAIASPGTSGRAATSSSTTSPAVPPARPTSVTFVTSPPSTSRGTREQRRHRGSRRRDRHGRGSPRARSCSTSATTTSGRPGTRRPRPSCRSASSCDRTGELPTDRRIVVICRVRRTARPGPPRRSSVRATTR